MSLSVESRLKAHISTPYIDADGRGTNGTYAADYADCMKSPTEFAEIQRGGGKDDALLKELESHCASLIERSKEFQKVIVQRELDRRKALAEDCAVSSQSIAAQRMRQIECDRDADSAKLDAAYHKRLESDLDMDRYLRLLAKSEEAKTRDREENVASRHDKLKALAASSRASQQALLQDERQRTEHLNGLKERMLLEIARQDEARRSEMLMQQQRDEMAALVLAREREGQLRVAQAIIRAAQEADSLQWEHAKQKAVAAAAHAAHVVAETNCAASMLVIQQQAAAEKGSYDEMKRLQSAFESTVLGLQEELKRKHEVGSYLEHLMRAAKAQAEKDKKVFAGLSLLHSATMSPSMLTPTTVPQFEGPATRTVGTLTVVSEPLRTPSRGGGSQGKHA